MQDLSRNLLEDRIELGLSQQDAAMLIGVSRITYIKWEKNTSTMPIGKYEDLMLAFERLKELKEEEA